MDNTPKFVVKHRNLLPKEETTATMILRLDIELQQKYDELARKSDCSRNDFMNEALKFAIEHLEFMDEEEKP